MIIYWSMLLWVPFIYLFYSLNCKEEVALTDYNIKNGTYNKIPISYAMVVFGYFTFWIGMRYNVADTSGYIWGFYLLSNNLSEAIDQINWEGKSPGFDLFNAIFKNVISDDFQVWLMFIAVVCSICILVTLRKYSIDFFFSSFLFISMLYFTWMINGMRQFIAVSILFVCSEWIIRGKLAKYLIVVALLSTIHSSVWLMLPIYFVIRGNPWKWKTVVFIVSIIIVTMFAEPILGGATEIFGSEYYSNSIKQFAEDDGVNPIRVVFYIIPPLLAFWCKDELENYYEKYPILPISINASLITAALYFVGIFTSGILVGRLPIYCDMYNMILIPFILHVGLDESNKKIIKYVYILVLVAFFYLLMNGQYYHSDLTGMVY